MMTAEIGPRLVHRICKMLLIVPGVLPQGWRPCFQGLGNISGPSPRDRRGCIGRYIVEIFTSTYLKYICNVWTWLWYQVLFSVLIVSKKETSEKISINHFPVTYFTPTRDKFDPTLSAK